MIKIKLRDLRNLIKEAVSVDENILNKLKPFIDLGARLESSDRQINNGTYTFSLPLNLNDPRKKYKTSILIGFYLDATMQIVRRLSYAFSGNYGKSQESTLLRDVEIEKAVEFIVEKIKNDESKFTKGFTGAKLSRAMINTFVVKNPLGDIIDLAYAAENGAFKINPESIHEKAPDSLRQKFIDETGYETIETKEEADDALKTARGDLEKYAFIIANSINIFNELKKKKKTNTKNKIVHAPISLQDIKLPCRITLKNGKIITLEQSGKNSVEDLVVVFNRSNPDRLWEIPSVTFNSQASYNPAPGKTKWDIELAFKAKTKVAAQYYTDNEGNSYKDYLKIFEVYETGIEGMAAVERYIGHRGTNRNTLVDDIASVEKLDKFILQPFREQH